MNDLTVTLIQKYQIDKTKHIWVRKAINAAIERSRMIQFFLNGQHCIAHNFTPQLSCFFDNKNDEDFDPVKAKQWLAKAGYPDGKNFPNIKIARIGL